MDSVIDRFPAIHLRWEDDTVVLQPVEGSINTGDPGLLSIEFPKCWQLDYSGDAFVKALLFDVSDLLDWSHGRSWDYCQDSVGYFGRVNHDLWKYHSQSDTKKPMYLVRIGHEIPSLLRYFGFRQAALNMDLLAFTLTELAVMEHSGLIHAKIVSFSSELNPLVWRKWIMGDALVPSQGILADLKDLVR
jgi:hypothetical protein